jgi:GAF domain-containing protein
MKYLRYPFTLLNALKYPQKFTIISLLFVLPLFSFYTPVTDMITRADHYGSRELEGTLYLRSLQPLLYNAYRHQFIMTDVARGEASLEQVEELRVQIDKDIQKLDDVESKYGTALKTASQYRDVKGWWQRVRSLTPTATVSEIADDHSGYISRIRILIKLVGETSYLLLDPELDTYYMMDAVLIKLPESQILLSDLSILAKQVSETKTMTIEQRTRLLTISGLLRSNTAQLEDNIQTAIRNNASGEMRASLGGPLVAYVSVMTYFVNITEDLMANTATTIFAPSVIATFTENAIQAHTVFYETASRSLEVGVTARRNLLIVQVTTAIASAVAGVTVAFILGFLLMLAISRPLTELTQATQRLARGDMTARVRTGEDEAGQVGVAFNNMAQEIQTIRETLEHRVADRTKALAASLEVSRRLSTILDQFELVTQIVQQVQSAFNYYHAHIYLFDDAREYLVMASGTGEAGERMRNSGHKILRGRGLVGRAAEFNIPVLVPDVALEPQWLPNPLLPDTKAEAAVPIAVADRVLGVLDIQHNIRNGLTQDDVDLLLSIANQAAIALQNTRALTQAQRQADYENLINAITQKIRATTSVENAMQVAIRELGRATLAPYTQVRLRLEKSEDRPGTH